MEIFKLNVENNYLTINWIGVKLMAKVKGTNKRIRSKSHYKKPGTKRGRGIKKI